MGLDRMTGTSWHITNISMKENDSRRHKSRCVGYDKNKRKCKNTKSPYFLLQCGGSSKCKFYEEEKTISEVKSEYIKKDILKSKKKKKMIKKSVCKQGDKIVAKNLKTGEEKAFYLTVINSKKTQILTLIENKRINEVFLFKNEKYKIIKIV